MFTFSYTRISFITFALFFFSKLSSIIKAFFSYWQISVFQSFSEVVLWKGKKRKKIKLLCLSVLILILDNKLKKKQLHITVGNLYTFFSYWFLTVMLLSMYFKAVHVLRWYACGMSKLCFCKDLKDTVLQWKTGWFWAPLWFLAAVASELWIPKETKNVLKIQCYYLTVPGAV